MNYRHAYHAGNHADVLKHIVLSRLLVHLAKKDKGFFVLDAHAGLGLYGLESVEALKTGEAQNGVARVLDTPFARSPLMAPWRDAVAAVNPLQALAQGTLTAYPGSPELIRRLTRPQDRLCFNELHEEDHASLAARYAGDPRIRVTQLDAAIAVRACLPPLERRGLTVLDPAWEVTDEAARVVKSVQDALRRFATGMMLIWYPIVTQEVPDLLKNGIAALKVASGLVAEVHLRPPQPQGGLVGSGLIILNPPWLLDEELKDIVPGLLQAFGAEDTGRAVVETL